MRGGASVPQTWGTWASQSSSVTCSCRVRWAETLREGPRPSVEIIYKCRMAFLRSITETKVLIWHLGKKLAFKYSALSAKVLPAASD